MKTKNSLFSRNLLCKIMLTLALVVGWNDAWGDDTPITIYNNTNTNAAIPFYGSGVSTAGKISEFIIPSTTLSSLAGKDITGFTFYSSSANVSFGTAKFQVYLKEVDNSSFEGAYLGTSDTTVVYYNGTLSIASNQMAVNFTKHFSYSGEKNLLVGIKCVATGSTTYVYFYGDNSGSSCNYYYTYKYISDGFRPKMTISYSTPSSDPMTISPTTEAEFGSVTSTGRSKDYTITNKSGATVTITPSITGDTEFFSISPSTATDIDNNDSQTFTISCNYEADLSKFGDKEAEITLAPETGDPFVISATATAGAALTLDETTSSTITGGTKSILIKYNPQDKWNTICMPFALKGGTNNFMDNIFGEGWKAYTLNSYVDGVLTFTKQTTTLSSGQPYLVYIETAPKHADGVVITANPLRTEPEKTSSGDATFKGTFAPIAAPGMDGKYGITTEGKLGRGNSYASIKGYRAYIEIADPEARPTIVFEDDETTDLGFVKMIDPEAKNVYTLSGQKVEKAGKGIYIVNGRKVVIK